MYDGGASQQKQNAAILDAVSAGSNLILLSALDPNFIQLGLDAGRRRPEFPCSQLPKEQTRPIPS